MLSGRLRPGLDERTSSRRQEALARIARIFLLRSPAPEFRGGDVGPRPPWVISLPAPAEDLAGANLAGYPVPATDGGGQRPPLRPRLRRRRLRVCVSDADDLLLRGADQPIRPWGLLDRPRPGLAPGEPRVHHHRHLQLGASRLPPVDAQLPPGGRLDQLDLRRRQLPAQCPGGGNSAILPAMAQLMISVVPLSLQLSDLSYQATSAPAGGSRAGSTTTPTKPASGLEPSGILSSTPAVPTPDSPNYLAVSLPDLATPTRTLSSIPAPTPPPAPKVAIPSSVIAKTYPGHPGRLARGPLHPGVLGPVDLHRCAPPRDEPDQPDDRQYQGQDTRHPGVSEPRGDHLSDSKDPPGGLPRIVHPTGASPGRSRRARSEPRSPRRPDRQGRAASFLVPARPSPTRMGWMRRGSGNATPS